MQTCINIKQRGGSLPDSVCGSAPPAPSVSRCVLTLPPLPPPGRCSRRAQVPRCDHHLRDDHGRLSRAEEAAVALRGHRRGPPPQEQELQAAGGAQAHEPGQSVSRSQLHFLFHFGRKIKSFLYFICNALKIPALVLTERASVILCSLHWPIGTQGPADGNAAAELGGGALQPVELSGTCAVSFGDHLPGGVW